jgi:hypothetical protein
MQKKYKPRLVISVPGIRTHSKWQKTLSEVLANNSIPIANFDFDYFSLLKFMIPYYRTKKIEEFYEFYHVKVNEKSNKVDLSDHNKYPSVIAHSFGSYIIGYCLIKYKYVKFDKIILCGCILPDTFDWTTFISDERIHFIRNEYSRRDIWAKVVKWFVSKTGNSGAGGFGITSNYVEQEEFQYYRHSSYFKRDHIMTYWLPFLFKNPPSYTIKNGRDIRDRDEFQEIFNVTTTFDTVEFGKFKDYNKVEVSDQLALTWIDINPDIYTFLFKRGVNKPKGYINAIPVKNEIFDLLKSGKIQDNQINEADILTYEANEKIKIYFMSIAIDREILRFPNGLFNEPFEVLINGFLSKIYFLAITKKIKIDEIVAIGWTEYGKRLCKIFGMEIIGEDEFKHPIYYVNLSTNKLIKQSRKYPLIAKIISEYENMD